MGFTPTAARQARTSRFTSLLVVDESTHGTGALSEASCLDRSLYDDVSAAKMPEHLKLLCSSLRRHIPRRPCPGEGTP
jgi:hypothetical protein